MTTLNFIRKAKNQGITVASVKRSTTKGNTSKEITILAGNVLTTRNYWNRPFSEILTALKN